MKNLPFTPIVNNLLILARLAAEKSNCEYVGIEHIFAVIMNTYKLGSEVRFEMKVKNEEPNNS